MTNPEAQQAEPVLFTSTTPAGILVEYSPAPRRFYRVNGQEVPSVTTVLGVLNKPLAWWGMQVGVAGVLELVNRGIIRQAEWGEKPDLMVDAAGGFVDAEDVVKFLTENRLTVNHTLTRAGDRGTDVHTAFETWTTDGTLPYPEVYPEEQRGYITGLRRFMDDFSRNGCAYPKTEVMVGSAEHQYAGRYDLRIEYWGGPLVTKCHPRRADKTEPVPEGKYLIDLKSSSGVYESHKLQLAAYEGASIECGYPATDYRAVLHVTADGKYEFVTTDATLDEFLAVRKVYDVINRLKGKAQ